MSLAKKARTYSHVFVIVADNDAKTKSIHCICNKYKEFRDAIWLTEVTFAGHMRRKDLPAELVSKKNMFLRNKLDHQLKGTRIIKREDFWACHFDRFGEGYRHFAALILPVQKDFCATE